jgi:hypothetical protein
MWTLVLQENGKQTSETNQVYYKSNKKKGISDEGLVMQQTAKNLIF